MLPWMRNATPPNIFFSTRSGRLPSSLRMRSASPSSKAMLGLLTGHQHRGHAREREHDADRRHRDERERQDQDAAALAALAEAHRRRRDPAAGEAAGMGPVVDGRQDEAHHE